jgi:hypothetical protein
LVYQPLENPPNVPKAKQAHSLAILDTKVGLYITFGLPYEIYCSLSGFIIIG